MNEFDRQARERDRILEALRALEGSGDRAAGQALVIEYFRIIGASDYAHAWEAIGEHADDLHLDMGLSRAAQD